MLKKITIHFMKTDSNIFSVGGDSGAHGLVTHGYILTVMAALASAFTLGLRRLV